MKIVLCTNCDNSGWVCEAHPDRPAAMFSTRPDACDCGAAEPCAVCNTEEPPRMPHDFVVMCKAGESEH